MFSHPCIKCHTVYQSEDPDPYYCDPCNEQRKAIAADLDRKMAGRERSQPVSDLQAFEANAKHFTSPDGRTITFGKL